MDDLLKSIKDVQSAKQLAQNVTNMCQSGGFNLTKFMSNSKELLATIPEEKRKEGVKDKDLSGDLPNDKALGICWNIEKDTFSFKINMDRKPITKSGFFINDKFNILSTWFCFLFCVRREKNFAACL